MPRAEETDLEPPRSKAGSEGRVIDAWGMECLVCKEGRVVEMAHIIPRRLVGDELGELNLIPLCPTHHVLFDRQLFSPGEWLRIDRNELRRINILLGMAEALTENIKEKTSKSKKAVYRALNPDGGVDLERLKSIVFAEPAQDGEDQ